ncbi:hypothetical protein GCK32_011438, partial [Trichostrongylus colubriformis]
MQSISVSQLICKAYQTKGGLPSTAYDSTSVSDLIPHFSNIKYYAFYLKKYFRRPHFHTLSRYSIRMWCFVFLQSKRSRNASTSKRATYSQCNGDEEGKMILKSNKYHSYVYDSQNNISKTCNDSDEKLQISFQD